MVRHDDSGKSYEVSALYNTSLALWREYDGELRVVDGHFVDSTGDVVARFEDSRAAEVTLRAAGFEETEPGRWNRNR